VAKEKVPGSVFRSRLDCPRAAHREERIICKLRSAGLRGRVMAQVKISAGKGKEYMKLSRASLERILTFVQNSR